MKTTEILLAAAYLIAATMLFLILALNPDVQYTMWSTIFIRLSYGLIAIAAIAGLRVIIQTIKPQLFE